MRDCTEREVRAQGVELAMKRLYDARAELLVALRSREEPSAYLGDALEKADAEYKEALRRLEAHRKKHGC
jgi:hypothetical protein